MTNWRHFLPSPGFLLTALTCVGVAIFFAWASRTPPLEDAWRIHLELQGGRVAPLSRGEFSALQKALWRYPEIADNFLEGGECGLLSANADGFVEAGFAYLLRIDHERGHESIFVESADPQLEGELRVTVRTTTSRYRGSARRGERFVATLAESNTLPQLIEVVAWRAGKKKKKRAAPIRVGFIGGDER